MARLFTGQGNYMKPSELLRVYAASGMPYTMPSESLLRLAKSLEERDKIVESMVENSAARYKDAARLYRHARRLFGVTMLINLAMIVAWLLV